MALTANHNVAHNGASFAPGDTIPPKTFDHDGGAEACQALIDAGAITGKLDTLATHSVAELADIAKEAGLVLEGKPSKAQLIAAIEAHRSKGGEGDGAPAAA